MASPRGIDWSQQPLGEVPDAVLARQLRVSTNAVRNARRVRGIDGLPVGRPPIALTLDLPADLREVLERDARALGWTPRQLAIEVLRGALLPEDDVVLLRREAQQVLEATEAEWVGPLGDAIDRQDWAQAKALVEAMAAGLGDDPAVTYWRTRVAICGVPVARPEEFCGATALVETP